MLSKLRIKEFIQYIKYQIDVDISPYIDLNYSARDYLNINFEKIPYNEQRRIMSLSFAYGAKRFKISDNGGLGKAFHVLKQIEVSDN